MRPAESSRPSDFSSRHPLHPNCLYCLSSVSPIAHPAESSSLSAHVFSFLFTVPVLVPLLRLSFVPCIFALEDSALALHAPLIHCSHSCALTVLLFAGLLLS